MDYLYLQRRVRWLTSSGIVPESCKFSKRRTSRSVEKNNQSMVRGVMICADTKPFIFSLTQPFHLGQKPRRQRTINTFVLG
jgi:hypothetical protein